MGQITMPHPDGAERKRVLFGGRATVKSLVCGLTRQYRPLPGAQFRGPSNGFTGSPRCPSVWTWRMSLSNPVTRLALPPIYGFAARGGEVTVTVRGTVTDRRDSCLNSQVITGLRVVCCGDVGRSCAWGGHSFL